MGEYSQGVNVCGAEQVFQVEPCAVCRGKEWLALRCRASVSGDEKKETVGERARCAMRNERGVENVEDDDVACGLRPEWRRRVLSVMNE